jgi:hypothetical protein
LGENHKKNNGILSLYKYFKDFWLESPPFRRHLIGQKSSIETNDNDTVKGKGFFIDNSEIPDNSRINNNINNYYADALKKQIEDKNKLKELEKRKEMEENNLLRNERMNENKDGFIEINYYIYLYNFLFLFQSYFHFITKYI